MFRGKHGTPLLNAISVEDLPGEQVSILPTTENVKLGWDENPFVACILYVRVARNEHNFVEKPEM